MDECDNVIDLNNHNLFGTQTPHNSIKSELLNENDAKEIYSLTKKDGFFNDNKSSLYKNIINYTNQLLLYNTTIYQTMLANGVKITFPCVGKQDYSIKLINANYLIHNKSLKITKEEFSKVKIIFLGIFVISKEKTTNNLTLNYLKWSFIPQSFKSQNNSNDEFYLIDHGSLKINSFLEKFLPIKEEEEAIKEIIIEDKPFCFSDMDKINNQEFRERKRQNFKKPKKESTIIRPKKSKEERARDKQYELNQKAYYFNERNLEHIKGLWTLNDIQCIFWYNVLIDDAKLIIDTPYFKSYMKLVNLGKYSSQYMQKLSLEQRLNLHSDFNKGMRFIKGLELSKKQGVDIEHVSVIKKDGSEDWMNLV